MIYKSLEELSKRIQAHRLNGYDRDMELHLICFTGGYIAANGRTDVRSKFHEIAWASGLVDSKKGKEAFEFFDAKFPTDWQKMESIGVDKVRRRIEDCLRKSSPHTVLQIATLLEIKID